MRVALYVRVSTQQQAQAQTIAQQLDRLQRHAQQQGWEIPTTHIFRDEGYSGASLRRPGLERLRDAVASAQLDRILITAPDRLARKYVHQVLLLDELQQYGCQVEFVERPMSQAPEDQLLLQIRGAVAEYERTLIAERLRRGRLMKYQAGTLLPWTVPPYGYVVDPERPRHPAGVRRQESQAAVVQDLFARYLEAGTTLHGLAKHLQAIGIASPSGKPTWNPSSIRTLLTNPTYTGQVYSGRTIATPARTRQSPTHPVGRKGVSAAPRPPEEWVAVARIPALVSAEQFAAVQHKLASNQRLAARHNTHHTYLLRTLVSCGHCQLACFGRATAEGLTYYMCRGKSARYYSGQEARCPARLIPSGQLDALVWADLAELLTHPEALTEALQRLQSGHWLPQEWQARRDQTRKGQRHLEHHCERLTQAYLQGIIPLAEYARRRRDLDQQLEAVTHQLQHVEAQGYQQQVLAGVAVNMEEFCRRVHQSLQQATVAQQRQLLELLVDRVIVTDEEVEIRYVIPTGPRGELTRFCQLRTDYYGGVRLHHRLAGVLLHPRDGRLYLQLEA
jgi:site-specific DNA recombinase